MSDINLIPNEFKIEREKKVKRNLYAILVGIVLLIIITITYIPIYMTHLRNNENQLVQQNLQSLSYVNEELSKLNSQKSILQDKVNVFDNFNDINIKWTDVIKDLSDLVPGDVKVKNISISKSEFTLQCTSVTQQAIAVFIANIENSSQFTFKNIGSIIPNDNGGNFTFDLYLEYNIEQNGVN